MKRVAVLLLIVVAAFLTFAYVFRECLMLSPEPDPSTSARKFNQHEWLAADQYGYTRLEMYDDLTTNHIYVGMKKKKILSMLGKPYMITDSLEAGETLVDYALTLEGFNPCFLALEFNKLDVLLSFSKECH